MRGNGIIWGTLICIPFWFIVILLIKAGVIAIKTLIFVDLALSAMTLFLILTSSIRTKQDKKDWGIIINDIPIPTFQSKTRPRTPSENDTPGYNHQI